MTVGPSCTALRTAKAGGDFINMRQYSARLQRHRFSLPHCVPRLLIAQQTRCVGDVRHGSIKGVASAVGEGAIAVQFIHRYMAKV
jgi:thioredoxin reductase (NADPH)